MPKSMDLTILQINDTHGYFELHNELFWAGDKPVYKKSGGYARIATIFKQIKNEKNGKVIILDNGDTLHSTFPAVKSKGKATLRLMKLTELIGLYAEYLEMDPDLFYFTSTA